MCKVCNGKIPGCRCRGKFRSAGKGTDPHIAKDEKITNQKGAFGRHP